MSDQTYYMPKAPTVTATWAAIGTALVITLYLLYRLALPRTLPGIPHNRAAAQNVLGDLPGLSSYLGESADNTLITYFNDMVISLNAPLVQVFLKPLSAPTLLLSDFNEARKLLLRPAEFERSPALKGLLSGFAPDHQILLDTDATWRAQRQRVQDVVKPAFVKDIAGPLIYQSVVSVMDAWRVKCRIANGRPWSAGTDVKQAALSAMKSFTFGLELEHDVGHLMLETLSARQESGENDISEQTESPDAPIVFPLGELSDVLRAMADLNETVMEIHGSPVPSLKWAYVNRKPLVRKARRRKEQYIAQRIQDAVSRMEQATPGDSSWVNSATDQVILREKLLADRDGRLPQYFSRVIFDELFGIIFAGAETAATTLCWLVKLLTDHPTAQNTLRAALEQSFPQANAENRDPTAHEILTARIPYLDAVLEEGMRCAATSPFIDRQATVDSEILGHHVPRGTVVLILLAGPSMIKPAFKIEESRSRQESKEAEHAETAEYGHVHAEIKAWDPDNVSQFLPERWLIPGDGDGHEQHKFDANAGPQLAFGLGPRSCFGKKIGYVELRIFVTLLCWRFQLGRCPSALSSYASELRVTNEPKQCYLRLHDLRTKGG